jgi:hypothetical protein
MVFLVILTRIAQFASAIPIMMGLIRYKHLPRTARVIFYYTLYSAFSEWFAYYLSATYHNNMPYLYIFTFVQFAFYSYVFVPQLLLFRKRTKQTIVVLFVLILGLLTIDLFIHSIYRSPIIARTAESILIVFMGLAYLLEYFQSDKNTRLSQHYLFWITIGAVTYFSISFFYTMVQLLVKQSTPIAAITTIAHLAVLILSYLFFAASLRIAKSETAIS